MGWQKASESAEALSKLAEFREDGFDPMPAEDDVYYLLLDMTNGNAVRNGVPTDVIRYSHHQDGQHFSEFVYTNMPSVDGLLYSSRFTEILCVAVYDRALSKIQAGPVIGLTRPILTPTLSPWNIIVR